MITASGEQVATDAREARAAADAAYRTILLIGLGAVLLALAGVALLNRFVPAGSDVAKRARDISGRG